MQLHNPVLAYTTRRFDAQTDDISITNLESANFSGIPFSFDLNTGLSSYGLENIDLGSGEQTSLLEHMMEIQHSYASDFQHSFLNFERSSCIPHLVTEQKFNGCMLHPEQSITTNPIENTTAWSEITMGEISLRNGTSFSAIACTEVEEKCIIPPEKEEEPLAGPICHEGEVECIGPAVTATQTLISHDANRMKVVERIDMSPSPDVEKTTLDAESKTILLAAELSIPQKQLMKSFAKSKTPQKDAINPKQQALLKVLGNSKGVVSPIEHMQSARDRNSMSMKQRLKQNCDQKVNTRKKGEYCKDKRDKPIAIALNVSFSITTLVIVHDESFTNYFFIIDDLA